MIVIPGVGMAEFMPTCLMLNELRDPTADCHARIALGQIPALLQELLRMRMLFVDVKPSNLGLLRVGTNFVLKVRSWPGLACH
jgi:hypothetical protein